MRSSKQEKLEVEGGDLVLENEAESGYWRIGDVLPKSVRHARIVVCWIQ